MTLNLALVISGDAAGGKRAVQETRSEVRNLGAEAKATAAAIVAANDQADASARKVTAALTGQELAHQRIQSAVNRYVGFSLPSDDATYRQRAADIAAYGNELDRLRAKYSPQFALMQQYEAELAEINQLHRIGALNAREHASAIATLKDRLAEQQKIGAGGISAGQQRQAGFNAGQQLQDIAITAAMGMPVSSIALAQGPQLATAIQQGGGWRSAVAGIASLVSPVNLVAIGLTAVTAATIQWAMSGKDSAKKLDEALQDHQGIIKALKEDYSGLDVAIRSAAATGGRAFTNAQARNSLAVIQAQIREQTNPYLDTLGGIGIVQSYLGNGGGVAGLSKLSGQQREFAGPVAALVASAREGKPDLAAFNTEVEKLFDKLVRSSENPTALRATADAVLLLGNNAFAVEGKFAPFGDAINKLRVETAEGKPDLDAFIASVEKTGQERGLQKLADDAIIAGKEIVNLARMAEELRQVMQAIDRENTRSGLADTRATRAYVARREAEARQVDDQFAADQQMARARTNAERLAAVEAQVRARAAQDADKDGGLQARVDRAIAAERTKQEVELRDAIRQRKNALDETLASARLDVELVGKNAAETARLRLEHQLIAEVRRAAAEAGVKADEDEIARIRQKMGEYQKLVSLQSARELLRDQGEQLEKLRLETALIGASSGTRERAIALMEAEQEIRKRGIDALSGEAQLIRQSAAAIADYNIALDRQAAAWDSVKRTGESAIDSLLDGDWKSAANDIIKSAIDFNIGNPLKNWIFGSGLPTGGDLGNIWGKLFGGADQDAGGLVSSILGGGQNVGAMSVNAGTVMVTGSIGVGGGLGSLAENASRLLSGANGNTPGNSGVMGKIWDFFSGKGLQPHQVAGIMGNVGAESSFNPSALNPKSGAFGLFQHLGSRLNGLGTGADLDQQLGFAWKELQTSEAGVLKKLLAAPDVRSATSAFAGFERAGGWSKANPEGIELWEQRLAGAQQSLEKFGGTANAANQSLGQFGNGLGQMGNALSQFPGAPGGGAGGILGSLFGGLNSAFSGSKAFNWLSSNPGSFIGLYDEGGYTGDGGKHQVAGLAHKGEFYFSKRATSNIGVDYLNRLHEAGKRGQGFADGGFTGGTFSSRVGGGRESGNSWNNGGRSVVEIRLAEGLRAELLQQAGDQAVQIVQANDRARSDYYRAGGEAA